MGIFDRFRHRKDGVGGSGTGLKDRATQMMSSHPDQVDKGMDRAGQMVDDKTGHKYTDQIHTGMNKAKDMMSRQSGESGQQAGSEMPRPEMGTPGGETPPPPPPQG
ncbi:MAG: antitoxin [Actinocrinis sp.]